MPVGEVEVEGLLALQRAFKKADARLATHLQGALREAAAPVRVAAEQLALINITNIGIPWSRMRIGVTQKSVYVAPVQRSTRRSAKKRPNLALLLLRESMLPAVDEEGDVVAKRLGRLIDDVADTWEKG